VTSADLTALLRDGRYEASTDFGVLEQSDVVIICVPTPLRKSKDPDISFVVAAVEAAAANSAPASSWCSRARPIRGRPRNWFSRCSRREGLGSRRPLPGILAERIDPGNSFQGPGHSQVVGRHVRVYPLASALYRTVVPVEEVSSPKSPSW